MNDKWYVRYWKWLTAFLGHDVSLKKWDLGWIMLILGLAGIGLWKVLDWIGVW